MTNPTLERAARAAEQELGKVEMVLADPPGPSARRDPGCGLGCKSGGVCVVTVLHSIFSTASPRQCPSAGGVFRARDCAILAV